MSQSFAQTLRRHRTGMALALLLACTSCTDDEFGVRVQAEACASVTFSSFQPGARAKPDTVPMADLEALLDDPAVLSEAMQGQRMVLRHFERTGRHDQSIVPAKFPVFFTLDSTAVMTEGLWLVHVLDGERLRIQFACTECATVDARGNRGPARARGIRHDVEAQVPGDVETPDFHLRLDARRGTLKPFEGQVFIAELVARETFLDQARPKLQLSDEGGSHRLRLADASAYVAERFLKELSIAMVRIDLQRKREGTQAALQQLDREIEAMRATGDEPSLAKMLERRAALQEGLAAFNPRFVVSDPAAACR